MADAILAVKVCKKCGESKPATVEFFNRHKLGAGGLNPRCKACRSIENKEYVANGGAEVYRNWRARNQEAVRIYRAEIVADGRKSRYDKKYFAKNRERENARRKMRYEANKDAHRASAKLWSVKNKQKVRESASRYAKKWARTPKGRVWGAINARLRQMFASEKGGRSWQDIFGYSFLDLRLHLERQFVDGMSWDNYGEWHIDHITPVKAFEFTSIDDPAAIACWSLPNLRPLWALDNMSKGAKIKFLL